MLRGHKKKEEEKKIMKNISIEDIKNHETFIKKINNLSSIAEEKIINVWKRQRYDHIKSKKVNYREASKQFFKTKELSY